MIWLMVASGGALGACLRYGVSLLIGPQSAGVFPWATFVVNVVGSFLIGLVVVLLQLKWHESSLLRGFIQIGFLGAVTTFSTFSIELFSLLEAGYIRQFAIYLFSSIIAGLIAVLAGMLSANRLFI